VNEKTRKKREKKSKTRIWGVERKNKTPDILPKQGYVDQRGERRRKVGETHSKSFIIVEEKGEPESERGLPCERGGGALKERKNMSNKGANASCTYAVASSLASGGKLKKLLGEGTVPPNLGRRNSWQGERTRRNKKGRRLQLNIIDVELQ